MNRDTVITLEMLKDVDLVEEIADECFNKYDAGELFQKLALGYRRELKGRPTKLALVRPMVAKIGSGIVARELEEWLL